jgi:hypothetical protein
MLCAARLSARLILLAALCGAPPLLAQTAPAVGNAAPAPASASALSVLGARAAQCSPLPTDAELERAGARIGHIYVDIREIFDLSDPQDNNWIFRMADRLHFDTRERAILAQLQFVPGDRYSRAMLDETERIMRVDYNFIREPRIRPICYHDGQVDILVTTHEVWTLQPGIDFGRSGGTNAWAIDFADTNFLGLGKNVEVGHAETVDRASTFINWADPNIVGTHWIDAADFSKNSDGTAWGIAGAYPFIAVETPYTIGTNYADDHGIVHRYSLGQIYDAYDNDWRVGDFYAGEAVHIDSQWVDRLMLGWHVDRSNFYGTPEAIAVAPLPANRFLSYPYVRYEWLQNDYSTMQNLDLIARTEDVHFGLDASLGFGVATPYFGSDRDSILPDAELKYGFRFGLADDLFLTARVATRYEEGALHDFIATGTAAYYVATSDRSRLLMRFTGKYGYNLDLDHYVELGGDDGLRGYPLRYQNGSQDALFTIEERVYTRYYLLRLFNVGGAAFFDSGRTWGYTPVPTPNLGLLKDAGVGLRLGNARTSLGSVIHIDLAFPFERAPGVDRVQLLISTQATF